MHRPPKNIKPMLKFPTILIYFDDFCNYLYASITEIDICNLYFGILYSPYRTKVEIH